MSEDKTISIMTHDENVLCMDLNSFELCHIKTYEYINNNHLKLIQIEIIDVNALHMFVEVSGMRIYARPFGGREIKFIFSGMHISFECDERYLCAEHDGTVTTDRKKIGDWEKFLLCALV